MNKETAKTKNGGAIKINVFESVEEYVTKYSKETALKNLNRMERVDAINTANRKTSVTAQLKAALKSGKITQAQIDALLK